MSNMCSCLDDLLMNLTGKIERRGKIYRPIALLNMLQTDIEAKAYNVLNMLAKTEKKRIMVYDDECRQWIYFAERV